MTTIRRYLDEDSMDRVLVRALRARRMDVTTAFDEGMIDRTDAEHLDYATTQGRAVYTFNVADFYRLHSHYLAHGKNHSGIVLARQQRYSVNEQMRRLLKLIATRSAEEMTNSVEFLSAWG